MTAFEGQGQGCSVCHKFDERYVWGNFYTALLATFLLGQCQSNTLLFMNFSQGVILYWLQL